jgi:GxxExxY protein
LESIYEQAFAIALAENGTFFQRQIAVPVWYHDRQIGDLRADLLVEGKIIIELKTGRGIDPGWEKQLLDYLRAPEIEVGLLFISVPRLSSGVTFLRMVGRESANLCVSVERK